MIRKADEVLLVDEPSDAESAAHPWISLRNDRVYPYVRNLEQKGLKVRLYLGTHERPKGW